MRKHIVMAAFVAAFAFIAGYGVYTSQQETEMSDLVKANVEALANREGGSGNYAWSNDIDCPGIGTGSYRVCESNGPGNSCSNPGGKTCDCGRNC